MTHFRREEWGRIEYNPNSDEFEAYLKSGYRHMKTERPISAGVLITGKCNLKCEFCYGNDESLPKTEIDLNHWARIFARLRSWGLMRIDISGGEPTIRKDLPKIAEAAQSFGLAVVISTNGLLLDPAALEAFPNVRWHVSLDSGLAEIHERSRRLRVLKPSAGSLEKTAHFLMSCAMRGIKTRALTCVGRHNSEALFSLGEGLTLWGVTDWNISRVLKAGRAKREYESLWQVSNTSLSKQVNDLRRAFPHIRIRYSDRTEQDGYFLLLLPDGSIATQYTDHRDKVVLGDPLHMTLSDLQSHPDFDLPSHGRKWIAAELQMQGRDDRLSFPSSGQIEIGNVPEFGLL
jgi:hypothetical protein